MPVRLKKFQQGRDFAIYKLGGVLSGGVCLAMCSHYLVHRYQRDDYWGWLSHVRNKALIINTHGREDLREGGYMQECWNVIQAKLKASWSIEGQFKPSFILELLRQDRSLGRGDYKLIVLEAFDFFNKPKGAHALAFTSVPSLRFFDPNSGEYEFTSVMDCKTWIRDYLKREYFNKGFKRYTLYGFDPR
jgi:hypothetical protein